MTQEPSREEAMERLRAVIAGRQTREDAASWAMSFVLNDVHVHDELTWRALTLLGGADLQDGPGSYLHNSQDLCEWLRELTHEP